jgi:hypothetical protein
VEEVDGTAADRVMISSEFFSEADDAHAAAIMDRLDRRRTHVVLTLRPLSRILASQWQQFVQNRIRIGYLEWLREVLCDPGMCALTPTFWTRHRHDELVVRWAEAAGADRVTVVVLDDSDRRMLLSTFERILALTSGTLRPPDLAANRSLTFPEVEFVRAFNAAYDAEGWSEEDYFHFVRFGAVRHLQGRVPPADEPRILTPRWAVEACLAIQEAMVGAIAASGVRVVGDLGSLRAGPREDAVGENRPVAELPPDIPARFTAGLVALLLEVPAGFEGNGRPLGPLEAGLRARREEEVLLRRLRRQAPKQVAHDLSERELARVLWQRVRELRGPRG